MFHSQPHAVACRHATSHRLGAVLRMLGTLTLGGWVLGILLATATVQAARAQPAAARQAAAGTAISPDALLDAAVRVLALLDADDYAPLWQEMPPELQSRFKRETFLADMKSTRRALGTLRERNWSGVGRLLYGTPGTPQGIPAGLYANVDMASFTTDGRALVERVSFRIESNGSVRFTGYVPRLSATAGSTPPAAPAATTP